jgi:hypothetical protein
MKKLQGDSGKETPNFAAILAIAAEMVRRLSANISKVQLQPMHSALLAAKEATRT